MSVEERIKEEQKTVLTMVSTYAWTKKKQKEGRKIIGLVQATATEHWPKKSGKGVGNPPKN